MPLLAIRNMDVLKYDIDCLFDVIKDRNWLTALRISNDLERDIAKYYVTRGQDGNGYRELIKKLQFDICSGWGDYRTEMVMDSLTELIKNLQSDRIQWSVGDPYQQIRVIYDSLQEDLPALLSSGSTDDLELVRQDLQALTNPNLEKAFNKLQEAGDFFGYKMYKQILQYSGQAMGGIMKITPFAVRNMGNVHSTINDFKLLFMTLASTLAHHEMITEKANIGGRGKEDVFVDSAMKVDEDNLTDQIFKLYDEGYDKIEIAEELGQDVAYIDELISRTALYSKPKNTKKEDENEDEEEYNEEDEEE